MHGEISEIKCENAAIHSENAAIHSENAAIHSENAAIHSENEALSADNTNLRELLDGHNKRLVKLENDLAASDNSNKVILKIHTADSQIYTNISSSYNQGGSNNNNQKCTQQPFE